MIDDDTYLLKHNLAELLSKYNHRRKYYFGQANQFVGCDGKKNQTNLKALNILETGLILHTEDRESLLAMELWKVFKPILTNVF